MKLWKSLLFEDIDAYKYLMNERKRATYQKKKIMFACIPIVFLMVMFLRNDYENMVWIPVLMLLMYKFPYMLLRMRHTQNCNEVVAAIPLWVNQIYALIERNTIHNAILNSLTVHTPKAIRKDLENFIEEIEYEPNSKEAYIQFLSRYKIDGFMDIMLKLYEFRNLSKDKLKYEIRNLNQSLGKIESLKRQNQFKSEVFVGDTCTCFIIFIPCIYMTVISLMPSLFQV